MASMELKATNFLSQKDSNYINFFLYGEEPSLTFRCLKHVLLNEDMKMIEKIYLNLDDENFESNFTQSIMTNSLFNEKKIIFINYLLPFSLVFFNKPSYWCWNKCD